jgi:hypothetical protein
MRLSFHPQTARLSPVLRQNKQEINAFRHLRISGPVRETLSPRPPMALAGRNPAFIFRWQDRMSWHRNPAHHRNIQITDEIAQGFAPSILLFRKFCQLGSNSLSPLRDRNSRWKIARKASQEKRVCTTMMKSPAMTLINGFDALQKDLIPVTVSEQSSSIAVSI